MKKEIMDFLENCTEEGIIDEFQKSRAIALDKESTEKRDLMMKNFLNLLVALMSVFLILFGVLVIFQKYNFINPTIKLSIAGVLALISLLGIAKNKINRNYFLMEMFVAMNICAILIFIMSANMEAVFRYRAATNTYLGAVAMLPIFFAVETYISLIVFSFVFFASSVPELNLVFITTPNMVLELIITALYLILLIFKFVNLYKTNEKGAIYSKYSSKEVVLMFLEVLILLFIFRLCYVGTEKVDIVFIYLIMLWTLIRRTTLFKGLAPIPMIVDIIIFFGVIYVFVLNEASSYNPTVVLTYHTIYFLVVLLLKQRGYLDYTAGIYRLQQYFYINLFIFVFAIDRVIDANSMWFVVTICLGLFNTFVGVKYKSALYSIIGFGIIVITLVFTALNVPSTIGGVMFSLGGIIIVIINRKLFREVFKIWLKA